MAPRRANVDLESRLTKNEYLLCHLSTLCEWIRIAHMRRYIHIAGLDNVRGAQSITISDAFEELQG